MKMEGLTPGRMVHYVLYISENVGEHRPAVITKVHDAEDGVVNLVCFYAEWNDSSDAVGKSFLDGHARFTESFSSIRFDESQSEGTWHWIEQA